MPFCARRLSTKSMVDTFTSIQKKSASHCAAGISRLTPIRCRILLDWIRDYLCDYVGSKRPFCLLDNKFGFEITVSESAWLSVTILIPSKLNFHRNFRKFAVTPHHIVPGSARSLEPPHADSMPNSSWLDSRLHIVYESESAYSLEIAKLAYPKFDLKA